MSLAITTFFTGFDSIRWLSLATLIILVIWIKVARFAGREFQRLSSQSETPKPEPLDLPLDKQAPDTEFA